MKWNFERWYVIELVLGFFFQYHLQEAEALGIKFDTLKKIFTWPTTSFFIQKFRSLEYLFSLKFLERNLFPSEYF